MHGRLEGNIRGWRTSRGRASLTSCTSCFVCLVWVRLPASHEGHGEFLKIWNYSLKALRTKGLFPTPVFAQREGTLRVDTSAGLELLGSACFFEHEALFAYVAPNPLVVSENEQSIEGFLSSIQYWTWLLTFMTPSVTEVRFVIRGFPLG